jgi:hypothetical protein
MDMNQTRKTLLSAAAGVASTRIAHMLFGLGVNDFLRPLGLARRRSPWVTYLAFLGAGAVVGGVSALLLAPSSGAETRARLTRKAEELGESATKQARELREHAREEVDSLRARARNNEPSRQA